MLIGLVIQFMKLRASWSLELGLTLFWEVILLSMYDTHSKIM